MYFRIVKMNKFTPTWLMIKQHNKTGLKYFCKTKNKDPIKYLGSGTVWRRHISKNGKDITTLWCQLFFTEQEIIDYATKFSIENNIVEARDESGKKVWANLIIENGIDGGGNKNIPMKDFQKNKLSDKWWVKTPEGEEKIIVNMRQYCLDNNLNPSAMSAVARGKKIHYKNYKCCKLSNNRNVEYEFKEKKYLTKIEKSKITSESVKKAKQEKSKPKIKYKGIVYNTLVDAKEKTGLSRFLLLKHGELLR